LFECKKNVKERSKC